MFERETQTMREARLFAEAAHAAVGQLRKYTHEPYINHPVAVAQIVDEVLYPEDHPDYEAAICAAYLHDVVEDTAVTSALIHARFGARIGYLVDCLTDVSKPEDGNRDVRKALDRAHSAEGDSVAQTIKLADLIDNSSTITQYDPNFARRYMREKQSLLAVLTRGHSILRSRATGILERYYAERALP